TSCWNLMSITEKAAPITGRRLKEIVKNSRTGALRLEFERALLACILPRMGYATAMTYFYFF
ncbi:MAG: hypothetical protein ABI656_04675, partial [bacterium]